MTKLKSPDEFSRTRVYQKGTWDAFKSACDRLGENYLTVLDTIGYSPSVLWHWEKSGVVPKVAVVAVEAMCDARAVAPRAPKLSLPIMVYYATPDQAKALESFCKAMGMSSVDLNGLA